MTLNIWRAIGDFFTNILFAPYDFFRSIGTKESWWMSNILNTILFLIAAFLFVYWLLKLRSFKKAGTE